MPVIREPHGLPAWSGAEEDARLFIRLSPEAASLVRRLCVVSEFLHQGGQPERPFRGARKEGVRR